MSLKDDAKDRLGFALRDIAGLSVSEVNEVFEVLLDPDFRPTVLQALGELDD